MKHNINWLCWLHMMISAISANPDVSQILMYWPAARGTSFIQRGLQERLLSERRGRVSLHIWKHPLQQNPPSLLEGSAAQDVHGRTECHSDVGSPRVSLSACFTLALVCCFSHWLLCQQASVQKLIKEGFKLRLREFVTWEKPDLGEQMFACDCAAFTQQNGIICQQSHAL